jgi:hypothetical protein
MPCMVSLLTFPRSAAAARPTPGRPMKLPERPPVLSNERSSAMRDAVNRLLAVMVGSVLAGATLADDSFRCGSRIIELGMTQSQVLEHCGDPTSRTVEEHDVRSGNQVVGKTQMHRWTYESYTATRVLVFDQDRLIDIE